MIKKLGAILYFVMFMSLVALTIYGMWVVSNIIVYALLVCMFLMFTRFSLGFVNPVTSYALGVMITIDKTWQVIWSPLLNLGVPKGGYRFGGHDDTASEVVGRNLMATNGRHWIMIEFLLSRLLEGGQPHSIPSIRGE